MLFEDDFTHEMTVQSQARGLSGVNLATWLPFCATVTPNLSLKRSISIGSTQGKGYVCQQ
jgi:hypothetical protein